MVILIQPIVQMLRLHEQHLAHTIPDRPSMPERHSCRVDARMCLAVDIVRQHIPRRCFYRLLRHRWRRRGAYPDHSDVTQGSQGEREVSPHRREEWRQIDLAIAKVGEGWRGGSGRGRKEGRVEPLRGRRESYCGSNLCCPFPFLQRALTCCAPGSFLSDPCLGSWNSL
jgi:hypothetical protein